MLAQASTGLIETWWVARLGTDALTGMALVFPVFMMMQMLSAGAMGGGISSAIACALGGGRRADADRWCCTPSSSTCCSVYFSPSWSWSPGPSLYGALGGEEVAEAALLYSERGVRRCWVGLADEWLGQRHPRDRQHARALAGDLYRGGPARAARPADLRLRAYPRARDRRGRDRGHPHHRALRGGAGGTSGPAAAWSGCACTAPYDLFSDILRVGAVGLDQHAADHPDGRAHRPAGAAGGPDAIAGHGTGARLEYLLILLVFGLGAPLVAMVGTNIGAASRRERCASHSSEARSPSASPKRSAWPPRSAVRLARPSATIRACWRPAPPTWCSVGPVYGFFGLGLSLYFASQGAARLFWPLFAGLLRLLVAVGGGWAVLHLTGLLGWLFAASGGRARRLWPDPHRGGRIRRLVPERPAAQRPPILHEDAHEE